MKFQCDRCKTRYSIADEKVRGKILKIRCKACDAIITVRDGAPARLLAETAGDAPARRVPRAASHTIEINAARPSGSMSITPVVSDVDTSPVSKLPEAEGAAEEWYLSVNGIQEGPLSPDQAQKRVAGRAPGVSIHAWRDDFTEWLPVEEVPVLAVHLPRAPAPVAATPRLVPKAAASAATASSSLPIAVTPPKPRDAFDPPLATPPPPVDSAGGFDFNIGEASRLVKLPILAPPVSSPRIPAASASGGMPGLPPAPRADEAFNLAISAASSEAAKVPPTGISVSVSTIAPRPRRRLLGAVLIAGGAAAAILGTVAFFALRGGDEKMVAPSGGTPQNVLVTDFYKKDNPLFTGSGSAPPAPTATPPDEPAQPPPDKGPAPDKAHVPQTPRPRVILPPSGVRIDPVTRPDPARASAPRGGKEDTFDGNDASEGLTPDDVRDMYSQNEVGLKRCYERALKSDPTSNVTKMVVKITIQPDGHVTDITVPDKGSELSTCVGGNIRNWHFRRSTGEFTTEFTVFFARRN